MSHDDDTEMGLFRNPKEVTQWVNREISDAARAFALRIRELNTIAVENAAGEMDLKKAEALHDLYYERWGDSLPATKENASDAEIYAAFDQEGHTKLATRKASSRSASR